MVQRYNHAARMIPIPQEFQYNYYILKYIFKVRYLALTLCIPKDYISIRIQKTEDVHKKYQLDDELTVKVAKANLDKKQLDFVLA